LKYRKYALANIARMQEHLSKKEYIFISYFQRNDNSSERDPAIAEFYRDKDTEEVPAMKPVVQAF
jgi:hypothetical protein